MKKRGQFYFVAAVVIVGVLIGFVTTLNSSQKTRFVGLNEIGKNLEIESESVMDYSELNNNVVYDFTEKFDSYLGNNAEIYFVTDSEGYFYNGQGVRQTIGYQNNGVKIIATINQTNYEFDALPGKNFYFVILQDFGGEQYVVTNKK